MEEQKQKMERERDRPKKHPAEPERDVLLFLLQNAPLEPGSATSWRSCATRRTTSRRSGRPRS